MCIVIFFSVDPGYLLLNVGLMSEKLRRSIGEESEYPSGMLEIILVFDGLGVRLTSWVLGSIKLQEEILKSFFEKKSLI